MLNENIKTYIDKSVLCWLATSSLDHTPNVSPKEVFLAFENDSIIIANIASPQTVKNIKENKKVCVSFIDVFVQKGYQLKGNAEIISPNHGGYDTMKNNLEKLTKGKYPFDSITKIEITKVKKIIAPSYFLYPEIAEIDRVNSAKKAYGI